MKSQRHTTQIREQTRNIEVQINEEEIGKLPKKIIQKNGNKGDQKRKQNGENTRIN